MVVVVVAVTLEMNNWALVVLVLVVIILVERYEDVVVVVASQTWGVVVVLVGGKDSMIGPLQLCFGVAEIVPCSETPLAVSLKPGILASASMASTSLTTGPTSASATATASNSRPCMVCLSVIHICFISTNFFRVVRAYWVW